MLLVSFKNIRIWPNNYGQKRRAYFLSHNSAIFEPIGLKFLIWVQETMINRLVIRNPSYDAYFSVWIFLGTFCGKMGVATTRAPNGVGPSNPTKKLAHWEDLLGQPLSRNQFSKFSGVNPPTKHTGNIGKLGVPCCWLELDQRPCQRELQQHCNRDQMLPYAEQSLGHTPCTGHQYLMSYII